MYEKNKGQKKYSTFPGGCHSLAEFGQRNVSGDLSLERRTVYNPLLFIRPKHKMWNYSHSTDIALCYRFMRARGANERGISKTFELATKIAVEISAKESELYLGLRLLTPRAILRCRAKLLPHNPKIWISYFPKSNSSHFFSGDL